MCEVPRRHHYRGLRRTRRTGLQPEREGQGRRLLQRPGVHERHPVRVRLTASITVVPDSHDDRFTFDQRFSEEFPLRYKTLRDHAFKVTGGEVTGSRRLSPPNNTGWKIQFVERLQWTVNYEEVHLKAYVNSVEGRRELGAYFRFYDNLRPHQALGYRTPAEVFHQVTVVGEERAKGSPID